MTRSKWTPPGPPRHCLTCRLKNYEHQSATTSRLPVLDFPPDFGTLSNFLPFSPFLCCCGIRSSALQYEFQFIPKGVEQSWCQGSVQTRQDYPHQTGESISLWARFCAQGHRHVGTGTGQTQTVTTNLNAICIQIFLNSQNRPGLNVNKSAHTFSHIV